MSLAPLQWFRVRGLMSIEDVRLDLTTDVTVLVGPNGAGKSNLIGALELLGRIRDHELQPFVLTHGGMSAILHRGHDLARSDKTIRLEAWSKPNGYSVEITPTADDEALLKEWAYFHGKGYEKPIVESLGSARESRLGNTNIAIAEHVSQLMEGWRVFHFHDTSADAPPKRFVDTADNLTLRPDAANLAALLLRLRERNHAAYERIVLTIRSVAPFFQDFVLEPEGDNIRLRWKQRDADGTFSANALSDGTLRFICMATLLLQPQRPRTIVLDEPELGLHPFAMHQFVEMLRSAAGDKTNAIVATQSVTLLNYFAVDEVAVVERGSHGTSISRPTAEALESWLDDFAIGELWEKNLIGGRPRLDNLSER